MAGYLPFAARYMMRMPTTPQAVSPLPAGVSVWFPAVGFGMGLTVGVVVRLGSTIDVWFAALTGLLTWIGLTRARPLAGIAGIANSPGDEGGVGAPPMGAIAVNLLIITKLVLMMLIAVRMEIGDWITFALILAWARFAMLVWVNTASRMDGSETAALWPADRAMAARWAVALAVVSLLWNYALLLAPIVLMMWQTVLRRRYAFSLVGVAAGVEVVETITLAAVVVRAMLSPLGME